jgi:hypothetical protein
MQQHDPLEHQSLFHRNYLKTKYSISGFKTSIQVCKQGAGRCRRYLQRTQQRSLTIGGAGLVRKRATLPERLDGVLKSFPLNL